MELRKLISPQSPFTRVQGGVSLVLCLLIAVEPVIFSGCSRPEGPVGPPDNERPPVSTSEVHGSIDKDEIGGEDISVFSVWDKPRAVTAEGKFSLAVSTEAAQLVLVRDGDGNVRGLSVSIPAPPGSAAEDLRFDAETTALAMLMATPGITVVDPADAADRLLVLRSLPHFSELVDFLATTLSVAPLAEVRRDPLVESAFAVCLDDWLTRDRDVKADGRAELAQGITGFGARIKDGSDPGCVRVELANLAWRYINVHRRELDGRGQEIDLTPIFDGGTSMNGGHPISLAVLFDGRYGQPTWEEDVLDLRPENCVAEVQYWISGLGWGSMGATLPAPNESELVNQYDIEDAAILSLIKYVMLPYLSFAFGMAGILDVPDETIESIYKCVTASLNAQAIVGAEDKEAMQHAAADLLEKLVSLLPSIAEYLDQPLFGLSLSFWSGLGVFLHLIGIMFGATNLAIVWCMWSVVPMLAVVSIPTPWPVEPCGSDTTAPAAVTDLRAVGYTRESVQLAWTAPGDDANQGHAARTDVRYDTESFDLGSWESVVDPVGEPYPPAAGQIATCTVGGLIPETWYYFAVRTADREGNWSGLSNVLRAKIPGEPEQVTWSPSITITSCDSYGWSCWTRYPGPPGCECPPESSVKGWCPGGGAKNFPPIPMTVEGDRLSGSLGIRGPYGYFTLEPGLVEIEGTRDGNTVDFTLRLTGSLSDDWLDPIFIPTGTLDLTVQVFGATISDQAITGDCRFTADASSDDESCVALHRSEGGGGFVSVAIGEVIGPICTMIPWSLDFAEVPIGQSSEQNVEIRNSGGGVLAGELAPNCADFTIVAGAGSFELAGGERRSVTVRFAPRTSGEITCAIGTGLSSCPELICVGTGVGPVCVLIPDRLEFRDVTVGSVQERSCMVCNTGTGTLRGQPILAAGPFTVIIGNESFSLGPGESWYLTIEFAPETVGEFEAALSFGSDLCAEVACEGSSVSARIPEGGSVTGAPGRK
jgi:hypothetical protein